MSCAVFLWGQSAKDKSVASLAEPLNNPSVDLHVFYVHGMGINPPDFKNPQDFETSQEFRKSFCKRVHCTNDQRLNRYYATEGSFDPNKSGPDLFYLGHKTWATPDDWRAAAPFVVNYRVDRGHGNPIYLHEINWWPLILSAKCRQIIAHEAALVGRDDKHTAVCSAKTVQDGDKRFTSYAWLHDDGIDKPDPSWPTSPPLNRFLKHDILDWGFADAVLAVGPLRPCLLEGIRELILHSYTPAANQEFVIVSHSLGSYLMFSALDQLSEDKCSVGSNRNDNRPAGGFDDVLGKTSHAYFMANQVSLLELANLDNSRDGALIAHLKRWRDLRLAAGKHPPKIVAWSDPGDLLTWKVPDLVDEHEKVVRVENRPAKNARRWPWLWLLVNPYNAHLGYDKNNQVVQAMIPKHALQ
ncbi:MAG: hypothetical protein WAK13_18860 [Terriglobales bacterium]